MTGWISAQNNPLLIPILTSACSPNRTICLKSCSALPLKGPQRIPRVTVQVRENECYAIVDDEQGYLPRRLEPQEQVKTPMSIAAFESPTRENLEKRFPPLFVLPWPRSSRPQGLFVIPAQRSRRGSPITSLRRRAGFTSHPYPQVIVRDELSDGCDEGSVRTRIVEKSCLAFVHHLPGCTRPGGEHGQPGGEGFDHRYPQRLRGRREHENVGGGERGREFLTLQHPRKDRRRTRELLFEVPACGSVSDEGKTHSGHFAENNPEFTDVLLVTQATHVEQKPLARVTVRQPDPPILRKPVGVKAPGIYTLWPQVQPLDTLLGKVRSVASEVQRLMAALLCSFLVYQRVARSKSPSP